MGADGVRRLWPAAPVVLPLAAAPPLQLAAALAGPFPLLNCAHGWTSALAYGVAAPWVALLLWRRTPRARMAAYVFLTFDVVRSASLGHPLPLALALALVLYLQTPPLRRLYPSMWSRARAWRRRACN